MDNLKLIREFIKDLKGEISVSPYTEEELIPSFKHDVDDDQSRVYYVDQEDSHTKKAIDVVDGSEFSFFQDGRQKTIQIGTIPVKDSETVRLIPIMYFTVASVILRRQDRNLSVFAAPEIKSGLLIEKKLITDQEVLARINSSSITIVDTSEMQTLDPIVDYYSLKRKALTKAKDLRLEVEETLLRKWAAENTGTDFILIDGTIMNFRAPEVLKRAVGISPSAKLSFPDFDKVLRLKENERSGIFSFHKDQSQDLSHGVKERFSWFLRLRTSHQLDPEYGLVRAEIHYVHRDNDPVKLVERLSSSLMLEKLPTSYPDNSWHKTLYPIRECSSYLSSIIPSSKSIQAQLRL